MTKHDRTYLQDQAEDIVTQAISEPGRMFWLPGYTVTVLYRGADMLQMWLNDKLHCEYNIFTQRDELIAQLVDDWALEQGDYDDKENDNA
jgi:hypothetical protein